MQQQRLRVVAAALVLTCEAAAAIFIAFVGWLLTVWMVDDSVAFRMAPQDWYFAAAQRGLVVVGGALAFGGLTYPMNRWCVAPAIPSRPWIAFHVSALLAALIAAAGIVGAVQFAVWKPYM